jgi:hypothetical protein
MTDERVAPAAFEAGVLIAFAVDDILGAREELATAKIELLGTSCGRATSPGVPRATVGVGSSSEPLDRNIYAVQQDGIPTAPQT